MSPVAKEWEAFGLRSNPFFQDALSANPSDDHPVSLLVGRDDELDQLRRQTAGEQHSRSIVEGDAGVGKTSLVNRLKADLADSGWLTHEEPIRIESGMGTKEFTSEALRELLRIRTRILAPTGRLGTAVAKLGRSPQEKEDDAFWDRAVQIVNGLDIRAGGVSGGIPGIQLGFQVERGRIAADVPMGSLYHVLREAVERLTTYFGHPILFHVNNLENLMDKDAVEAALLVRELRDYLMIPGSHWIFVGTSGIERSVFRVHTQVSGVFPEAIRLAALTPEEVKLILTRRYEHLSSNGAVVEPVVPDEAALLYARFYGDLRNFLRLLNDAANRLLGVSGIEPMAADRIIAHMAPIYAKRLQQDLGEQQFRHLVATIGNPTSPLYEFRVTDVRNRAGIAQGAASAAVAQWLSKKVIVEDRTEGRSKFYHITGEVCIAFGLPVPS